MFGNYIQTMWTSLKSQITEAGQATVPRNAVETYIMHAISVELDDGSKLDLIEKNERIPVTRSVELPVGTRPIRVFVSNGSSPLDEFSCGLPARLPDGCDGGQGTDRVQVVITTTVDGDGVYGVDYVCRTITSGDATTTATATVRPEAVEPTTVGEVVPREDDS